MAPDPAKGDMVIATVSTPISSAAPDASPVSCPLEFSDAVIAKGPAHLRQVPREDGSGLTAEVVAGTIDVAVRTKESPRTPPERPRPAPRGRRDGLAPARQRTSSAASSVPTTAAVVVS